MTDFEKLGAFYLGRALDPDGAVGSEPILYDSKDLTTHGLIVGMTGSGKTGLASVLLEEALLDGIPALVIDPKGDMANLLLRFENLSPEEFRPWVDPVRASRLGRSVDELAASEASAWEEGLSKWGQSRERIVMLNRAGPVEIFTPGNASGRPIALLHGLDPPPEDERADVEAVRDRIVNTVTGLLGLVGIQADPVTSREHVLLSSLVDLAWRKGEAASLASLVRALPAPPLQRIGVLDLETFYPARDRLALATRLNSLLASKAFQGWLEGESLDVGRLLFGADGRPRQSVLYIAHLSDQEKMFFVTLFLGEVITWMRRQKGTGSLRAILYMDEVFGFFPPVASPPSKAPMLTILKQARAFGLGALLATQNPVDLDYKGLANMGTWFLGRLQTKRDRDRLIEGLDTARSAGSFERAEMEHLLGSLPKRAFLMHNVHEDRPVAFATRWAMSYLSGPLTFEQVKALAPPGESDGASTEEEEREPASGPASTSTTETETSRTRTPVGPGVEEHFLAASASPESSVYRPFLLARVQLHYQDRRRDIDHWERLDWLTPISREPSWEDGSAIPEPVLEEEPVDGVSFSELPSSAASTKSYVKWRRSLARFMYRERKMVLHRAPSVKLVSQPGETEAEFRARCAHARRERRDLAVEKLRKRYAPKLVRLQEKVLVAEARLERETEQYGSRKAETAVDFGVTLAGALFGRKLGSLANARRASRAAKSAARASRERADVKKARQELLDQKAALATLEEELAREVGMLRQGGDALELELSSLAPRKSDIQIERLGLVWSRRVSAELASEPS